MSEPGAHIAAWEAAGLIDAATAARLRAAAVTDSAETVAPVGVTQAPAAEAPTTRADGRTSNSVSALFGPGVSAGEMFAYLGAVFLLGAWHVLVQRWGHGASGGDIATAVGMFAAAGVLVGLAAFLRDGSERFRRAAGVALVVATGHFGVGVAVLIPHQLDRPDPLPVLVGSLAALGAAVLARAWLPSVVTHLGALSTATYAASNVFAWLRDLIDPVQFGVVGNGAPAPAPGVDPMVLLVAEAVFWGLIAIGFGLVGLREAAGDSPATDRRATLSRAWAGIVAVLGVTLALLRTAYVSRDGLDAAYQRVLEPWIGDVVILIVSAILVERGFRRDASPYVYSAALGVIIAATDVNATYLSSSLEISLLVEGGILLVAGIVTDRLRRRIGGRPASVGPEAAPA